MILNISSFDFRKRLANPLGVHALDLVGSNCSDICITDELYQEQKSTLLLLVLSDLVFDQQNSRTDCMPLNFYCRDN